MSATRDPSDPAIAPQRVTTGPQPTTTVRFANPEIAAILERGGTWARPPQGRAATLEAKRAVLERILAAWSRSSNEQLRLGQLLVSAWYRVHHSHAAADLFYVEDAALADAVEAFG